MIRNVDKNEIKFDSLEIPTNVHCPVKDPKHFHASLGPDERGDAVVAIEYLSHLTVSDVCVSLPDPGLPSQHLYFVVDLDYNFLGRFSIVASDLVVDLLQTVRSSSRPYYFCDDSILSRTCEFETVRPESE